MRSHTFIQCSTFSMTRGNLGIQCLSQGHFRIWNGEDWDQTASLLVSYSHPNISKSKLIDWFDFNFLIFLPNNKKGNTAHRISGATVTILCFNTSPYFCTVMHDDVFSMSPPCPQVYHTDTRPEPGHQNIKSQSIRQSNFICIAHIHKPQFVS